MSLFIRKVSHGRISFNGLAEELTGGHSNTPLFKPTLKNICEHFSILHETTLDPELFEHRMLSVTLKDARDYCLAQGIVNLPNLISEPKTIEHCKEIILKQETVIANLEEETDYLTTQFEEIQLKLEKSENVYSRPNLSEELQIALQLNKKFWQNASPEERDSWESVKVINDWLVKEKGMTPTAAKRIQVISRPKFAIAGGAPQVKYEA